MAVRFPVELGQRYRVDYEGQTRTSFGLCRGEILSPQLSKLLIPNTHSVWISRPSQYDLLWNEPYKMHRVTDMKKLYRVRTTRTYQICHDAVQTVHTISPPGASCVHSNPFSSCHQQILSTHECVKNFDGGAGQRLRCGYELYNLMMSSNSARNTLADLDSVPADQVFTYLGHYHDIRSFIRDIMDTVSSKI